MKSYRLESSDSEDIEEWLLKVEKSFDIKFQTAELAHVKSFAELRDHFVDKISLVSSDDCTSQQAFYKLRKAVELTCPGGAEQITPRLSFSHMFQRKGRRRRVKASAVYSGTSATRRAL